MYKTTFPGHEKSMFCCIEPLTVAFYKCILSVEVNDTAIGLQVAMAVDEKTCWSIQKTKKVSKTIQNSNFAW